MSERPGPLPDDVVDLLEAEREIDAPPMAVRDRMFARLAPFVVPAGGVNMPDAGAGAASGGSSAATATVATAAWKAKIVTVAVSAALGAVGGAVTHAVVTRAPEPPNPASAPPAPPVEEVAPVTPAAPPSVVPPDAPTAVIDPTPPAKPAAPHAPAKATPTELRAERLLLETANAALVRGDHASAIATLRAHATKYPRGALAEEREVLMIQALSASGDKEAARERARAFKKSFPRSLQQGAVNKAAE